MRVAALEAIPVGLPFTRPYVTATGRLERREMLIVRIVAADRVEISARTGGLRCGPRPDRALVPRPWTLAMFRASQGRRWQGRRTKAHP